MPGKYRRKYKKKKRYYKKRKSRYNKINKMVVRGPLSTPDRLLVKLKYAELIRMTGLTAQSFVFRGNSCFDPNQSGVGAQPNGFDEWSALYTRYRVFASKIKCNVVNQDAAAGAMFVLMPSDSLAPIATINSTAGNAYVKTLVLGCATGNDKGVVSSYMSTKAMRGENISQEDDYSALTTANPAKQWYHILQVNSIDQSITSVDIGVFVEIVYYTEFFRRKQLDQS